MLSLIAFCAIILYSLWSSTVVLLANAQCYRMIVSKTFGIDCFRKIWRGIYILTLDVPFYYTVQDLELVRHMIVKNLIRSTKSVSFYHYMSSDSIDRKHVSFCLTSHCLRWQTRRCTQTHSVLRHRSSPFARLLLRL